ncbi:polyprenyl synthetase family protein [Priestia taiwanensis]|uniref:Farnesyl diphosphate synthase n=1 Tax=Priestia taiwanensis TaxID=1347902 RepID=A0A917AHU3_9BACI|nr:farnesyl diphosphate synthase [Priestia taiwanensis]MBM7361404.1 geranylgeranyl diphosphate synthase type II [Priestia taiwanensis]GGE53886.1 farnesyl-diphosphate synthase [Priestia taiwanensis]
MTIPSFSTFAKKSKQLIEQQLHTYVGVLESPTVLKESMEYSLQAGGKRIRPLLLFATLDAFSKDIERGLPVACALEMIHTYSLIHDDLPCMDDDDLRRGKPTNHKVFGEDIATLAGDALLTYAFQVIATMNHKEVTSEQKVALLAELATSAGAEGMIAGQVADMQAEGKELKKEELEYIHRNKTGKLLVFPVVAGAILAGATQKEIATLKEFSELLGLAFQIKDDILDVEGTEEQIGKRVGSDETNEKSTYVSLHSLAGAKEILATTLVKAKESLNSLQVDARYLYDICELVGNREN